MCLEEEIALVSEPPEEPLDVERKLEAGRDCWHCSGTGKVRTMTGKTVDCAFCGGTGKNRGR